MHDLIVLPTYNEAENIIPLLRMLFTYAPDVEVLVVDDGSTDGTIETVTELQKHEPRVHLLVRKTKTGLGDAYADALQQLCMRRDLRAIITMDADGSHQPLHLPALRSALATHDLIIGSRYVSGGGVPGWEWWRRTLSRGANWYARILTGLPLHDLTAGFIAIRHEALQLIDWSAFSASGYAYQIEFKFMCIQKLHLRAIEIPITFIPRVHGSSKLSFRIIREGILLPLQLLLKKIFTKPQASQ